MTIAITKTANESFDQNLIDSSGGLAILAALNNANPAAARLLSARPYTWAVEGTGLGNEALAIATNLLANLTTLGVTVPANTMRNIRTRCWAKRAAATNA